MGCDIFKIYFISLLTGWIWQDFYFFPPPSGMGMKLGELTMVLCLSQIVDMKIRNFYKTFLILYLIVH